MPQARRQRGPVPSRPFVVAVNGLSVRDVGTAFNVHEAAGRTAIAVIRGEVEVSPGAAPRSQGGKLRRTLDERAL